MEGCLDPVPFGLKEYSDRLWRERNWIDHGIIGAMMVCKLTDMLYDFKHSSGEINSYNVSYEHHFIEKSIAPASAAIAFHNINPKSPILNSSERSKFSRLLSIHPLIGLLRIADVLQDWGRPLSNTELEGQEISPRSGYRIR